MLSIHCLSALNSNRLWAQGAVEVKYNTMEDQSSRSDTLKIEPLDGSNYANWKFNVQLVLMERDLWGFIEGTETKPEATQDDKKEKEILETIWKGLYHNCFECAQVIANSCQINN